MAIKIASRRTSSKVISSRNSPGSVNPLAVPFSVTGLEATTLGGVVEELAESINSGEIGEGPAGPQGEQGPAGQDGAAGPIGPAGPQGDQGPMGLPGQDGQDGAAGPQGPAGQNGDQGPVGPMGLPGSVGPAGQDGADGAIGPAGPQGEQGPIGPAGQDGADGAVGPQGPAGDAVQSDWDQTDVAGDSFIQNKPTDLTPTNIERQYTRAQFSTWVAGASPATIDLDGSTDQTTTLTANATLSATGSVPTSGATQFRLEVTTGGNTLTIPASIDPGGNFIQPTAATYIVGFSVLSDGSLRFAGVI